MLQKISDRIQGWVAGIIILVILVAFSFWGLEYYISRGENRSTAVATVNGQHIDEVEFSRLSQSLKARVQAAYPNQSSTLLAQRRIKSLALQQLITRLALWQAAVAAGFHVNRRQVQNLILQVPEFQVKGVFSFQRFQDFLLTQRQSEREFIGALQRQLLINQVAAGLKSSAFWLPNELKNAYQLIFQSRDFVYSLLPLSRYLKKVKPTDQEIKAYYKKNKMLYKTPEKIRVQYLLLSPEQIEKRIKFSLKALKDYYNTNRSQFSTPRKWTVKKVTLNRVPSDHLVSEKPLKQRLGRIQKQLREGQSFDDVILHQKGVRVSKTVYSESTMSNNMQLILNSLTVNQFSRPFKTKEGFAFIQLLAFTPRKVKPFELVKSKIEQQLKREAIQDRLIKDYDDLSNLTYTHPTTLAVAAKKLGVQIQTSAWLTREGLKKGLFADRVVIQSAFSDDVLGNSNNSTVIRLSNGAALVLRVLQHAPSHFLPLFLVKKKIAAFIKKRQAEKEIGLQAYRLSTDLSQGISLKTLKKRYGVEWLTQHKISRDNKAIPKSILDTVFATAFKTKSRDVSGVNSVLLSNGDYAVVKVLSAHRPDLMGADFKRKSAQLRRSLSNNMGEIYYSLYELSVIKDSKISINPSF